ncbi:sensor histidine kinase [Corynebacterium glutamicum]|uniref:sensor histidine kinase n=1 Tax=Corynebacterium glutamicum TaxID=1718 RepID=UPI001B8D07FF|nr:histidine kinase [Corynebacterium glutamicum]
MTTVYQLSVKSKFWIVAICWIFGLVLSLFLIPEVFNWQDLNNVDDDYLTPRITYLFLNFITGLIAIALLPFALSNQNNAVVVTLCIFLGGMSMLGLGAGLVVFFISVSALKLWPSIRAVIAILLAGLVDTMLLPGESDPWELLGVPLLVGIAFLCARWWGMRRKAIAAQQSEIRSAERLRIARDMHDTLSHRLSLIGVYAGALEVRKDLDPETQHQQIRQIRQQAEEAVTDLRRTLKLLREEPTATDPREGIQVLVDHAEAAGTNITLEYAQIKEEDLSSLDTMASHCVYRTVQEALTNARKHAPNSPVSILIQVVDAQLHVQITSRDTGPTPHSAKGSGLIGLAERAELAGGSLTITRSPNFRIHLQLPWKTT